MMTSSAEALVNTVNTVGVIGKGIALQFKEEFPKNFLTYKVACSSGELTPGKLLITKELNSNGEEKIIINFPTKLHWRNPSKYEYITEGLKDLTKAISEHNIKSIAIPPLGCGNGGLDWNIVKGMIEELITYAMYYYDSWRELQSVRGKQISILPATQQFQDLCKS
jgi:O-acetyl-ADP-ribose deacetylase (regulator of RNase III)